ncbi:hypothetical protein [Actinoplanes sp. CA-252034]|uniref:hypothetical protein n=1 Tax=Actinoplanes sp. CA-252034 TaxID=3239906 RepID=UPI003D98F5BC
MLDGDRGADDGVPRADEGVTPVVVEEPVMPAPDFPTFPRTPGLPHQAPGNGFESGRDSRAR